MSVPQTEYRIVRLSERRDLVRRAAVWFASKWNVPEEAYLDSIEKSYSAVVPSWYLCLDGDTIVTGMGVIENDFHNRPDLSPNVCAVYTEPEYRGQGIAGRLLGHVCDDMAARGYPALYLLTDHIGFYERYGWEYLCGATSDGEDTPSRMYRHIAKQIKAEVRMDVTYTHKSPLTFIGFSTEIAPGEGYIKCPEFWDKAYNEKYSRLWQTMIPETPVEAAILENGIGMYAICSDIGGSSRYWIAGLYQGGDVPEGLSLCSFPESDWAEFETKGPLPASLQALNTAVWSNWFPAEGSRAGADGSTTVEVYSAMNPSDPDYTCGIWVPVRSADTSGK